MLLIPGFWVDMHRICMLNKSNAKQQGASLNPNVLPHHHYNEPLKATQRALSLIACLVSVSIVAKGKETLHGASHLVLCHASPVFFPCQNHCPQRVTTFQAHKNKKAHCQK